MTAVFDYHQTTKHSFHRFARSLGYLDWAAQPDPFRRFDGAPRLPLPRAALRPDVPYDTLFTGGAAPARLDSAAVGEFLRCAMGLSAWKQHQTKRWALRVNPSSGNLHPTECYLLWDTRLCHYAPADHALEVRAAGFPATDVLLVGLTSILWREAWKYGERAFRYCQHDVGHAIGCLRLSAALLGWQVSMISAADTDIADVLGTERQEDFEGAEREEPECLLLVTPDGRPSTVNLAPLIDHARGTTWSGRANVLSRSHVDWSAIDEVARATHRATAEPAAAARPPSSARDLPPDASTAPARTIILQRRSALGFDARSSLPLSRFRSMLRRLIPDAPPWDAIDWPPQVHLIVFVHRVDGLLPGVYACVRDAAAVEPLRAAMRPEFLWERVTTNDSDGLEDLFLLVPSDVRFVGNRLSCDQDIASDGFFSLAMIARVEPALREHGDWFYRCLFWECGVIGQVLYLEAEAAGGRATGIGCFYDDPVHEVLGLTGMHWQSLYHFSMGVPVDDGRLTSEAGYAGDW